MRYSHIKNGSVYKSAFLDTVGDGTGDVQMNVDGSTIPVEFLVTPDTQEILLVNRLVVSVRDSGGLDAGLYGNNVILVNGIEIGIKRDGVVIEDLTLGHPIKTNADWGLFCYDVTEVSFGAGDNYLGIRWTFTKDGAALRLNKGDSFFMKISDNLTALTGHTARLGLSSFKW